MKRLICAACAGVLVVAVGSPSFAADLPRKAPVYTPSTYGAPFSWSGFYVGLNGGYGWGKSAWTNNATGLATDNFKTSGWLGGGTAGYNLQTGAWVWGLEADIDYSTIKGSSTTICGDDCQTSNRWLGTGRGRIGYAWDRYLPFITGGAAYGSIKMASPVLGSSQTTNKLGWALGGGIENAFMASWSAKLEYLYVNLGKANCNSACSGGDGFTGTFSSNIVRLGLNYRF